ncbi:hypothetical protein HMPREF2141_03008 [Bacteroides uniformis]|nr:hypothetical protein HMPREF2141_03008 [Bacteroides uniformis]
MHLFCFHTSTHLLHLPIHRHLLCGGSNLKRWKQNLLPPAKKRLSFAVTYCFLM